MARKQSRSRSELIREAARLYIQGQRRWDAIFAATASALQDTGLTGADVAREIKQVRSGPRRAKG